MILDNKSVNSNPDRDQKNLTKDKSLTFLNRIYYNKNLSFEENKTNLKECDNVNIFNNNITEEKDDEKTFNNIFCLSNIKAKENENKKSKIIKFKTKKVKKETKKFMNLRRKRNSKIKGIIQKRHTALDDDNVLRKIQVQFISFIIHYSNDVVNYFIADNANNTYFQDIDYNIKKVVKLGFVEFLKKKTIQDILKFKITPKIKKRGENENEKIIKIVLKKCPSLKEFFETNYLDLFKQYYFNKNNIFEVNGQIVSLSTKTKKKTFSYLLEKNYSLKEKIKYVSINYLFNTYKRIKRPNFKTMVFDS